MMRHAMFVLGLLVGTQTLAFAQGIRDVSYGPKSVVSVGTKVRFTTLIVLPEGEEILDFVCGDKEAWVISGAQNFAYVKPAKAGAATNLNLVTASGQVYSFLLSEGVGDPDLKVYVRLDASPAEPSTRRRFHTAAEMDDLRASLKESAQQLTDAREAAARAVEEAAASKVKAAQAAADQVAAFRATYPSQLQFPYRFRANEKPFLVSAMFHDGRFTYLRTSAAELSALYELVDGMPNLLTFQFENGLYIVPKVLDRGYLTIGKQTLRFEASR